MKLRFLMFAAASVFAQAALADGTTYHCKVKGRDGWIAPEYQFRIDPSTQTAQVVSGYHDWMDASLSVRGNDTYRVIWNVTLQSSEGQDIRMRYQANLDPAKNKIKVRGSFVNVSAANKPYGTGNCAIVK